VIGPVEQAIRAKLEAGSRLHTVNRHKPPILEQIDAEGIVLVPAAPAHPHDEQFCCSYDLASTSD
jgi:hypothetical protein